jgi:hypothetical protein
VQQCSSTGGAAGSQGRDTATVRLQSGLSPCCRAQEVQRETRLTRDAYAAGSALSGHWGRSKNSPGESPGQPWKA